MNNIQYNTQTSSGIGFCGLLTLIFVIAKITGYLTWSWLWIFSPIWIPLAIICATLAIVFLGAIAWSLITGK